jgi:hypothetical protein
MSEMACKSALQKLASVYKLHLSPCRFHEVRGAVRARNNSDGVLAAPLSYEVEWKPLNPEPVQEAQVRIK